MLTRSPRPHRRLFNLLVSSLLLGVAIIASAASAHGQTTAFTYQGQLSDTGNPATGNYDFEFRLFDVSSGGSQQGSTVQRLNVSVTTGVFTVQLDFGPCATCFNGANRFLEISLRVAGGGVFTQLNGRQQVTSNPYAIKSLSAESANGLSVACVNCVTSGQIQSVNGSTVTGAIPVGSVPGGSASYVQNGTIQQATSNFNISGNGTAGGTMSANAVNAVTQFNVGGNRVLIADGSNNLFAGLGAGTANTTGDSNAFFGRSAGLLNTTGTYNAFFGTLAGQNNTTGGSNAFFGTFAGFLNTTGTSNAFFGQDAGQHNTTGTSNAFFGTSAGVGNSTGGFNAFFGRSAGANNTTGGFNAFFGTSAGLLNTTGTYNAFFGTSAGQNNTTGGSNAFFGALAGLSNSTGTQNTIIGSNANVGASNLTNATAIGFRALVAQSDSLILGSINGVNSATADTRVGIGTTAPAKHLHILGSSDQEIMIESSDSGGIKWSLQSSNGASNGRFEIVDRTANLSRLTILASGNLGIGITTPQDRLDVNGIIRVATLGAAGSTTLCRNVSNQIATCASSLRYKTDVESFTAGLDALRRLRPISFTWKEGGLRDVGFGAEEVSEVEPLLVTRNDTGEIEGVKYGQLTTILVNAVKEQQAQIEAEQRTIEQQQKEIDELKQLVCAEHPQAEVCRSSKK